MAILLYLRDLEHWETDGQTNPIHKPFQICLKVLKKTLLVSGG